ncbi:hypothetical protein BAUCODRAFT_32837 [Baudoinia panamericana UAMH 10762]|uniref:NADH-ubiquinone oxidoreductase B12 subunit n=1 Tax=Baudoinia panamericana (strain UAMH 10762) TaxID=717646 RepID=M2ND20_BAUPA|nr:uncharacterized protein BAUCODRAFT_32837 [Baudoinia panamericana UAMH 10762]EMC97094.1 hypothetical protein BAUCODRAFT_32837 [Baudoinia panamericana UAMH 10762]
MSSRRPNLTGFDTAKFAAAAGQPANDPWARHEAWRYTGPFTRWSRLRGAFPGLGIATVAFAGYMVYETLFMSPAHGHGDEHHGESHH